jgi:hypothetical protein
MIKINSFKIQGFYENNNTYLEFKTDEDNYLLKLSKFNIPLLYLEIIEKVETRNIHMNYIDFKK